jgi:hypothetical protein
MHEVRQENYMVEPDKINDKLDILASTGQRLDSDAEENIQKLQVLAVGERSGRLLAEIGYPDGTVVLFYRSMSGTSGKTQGAWYPIAGFLSERFGRLPEGWFLKNDGVFTRYGSNVFLATAEYLGQNEGEIF